jgi:hypothetical protein
VRIGRGVLAARPAGMLPPFVEEVPGFRLCEPGELPSGFGTGFWVELPLVDTPVYLDHLVERLRAAGGQLELGRVASLADVARAAPRVANCAGLGARELVPDPALRPVRGPKVVVENPGLDTFFMEAPLGPAWTAYLPHGDHVVLGGRAATATSAWSPTRLRRTRSCAPAPRWSRDWPAPGSWSTGSVCVRAAPPSAWRPSASAALWSCTTTATAGRA